MSYDENNLKPYKIEVGFYATDWEDVEDFIQSMSHKDWLNEVQEEEQKGKQWKNTIQKFVMSVLLQEKITIWIDKDMKNNGR